MLMEWLCATVIQFKRILIGLLQRYVQTTAMQTAESAQIIYVSAIHQAYCQKNNQPILM